jgi:hypothetical protein
MATVQKADIGMFDDIHALLEDFHHLHLGRDDWRRLFFHPWNTNADLPGFVLVQHSRIVGFLGTIFSTRCINGKAEQFCNVSSWIVKPEFRREGISLLLPLLRLRSCTLTNFSPSRTACQIFERLGFRYLDFEARVFYPPPHMFRMKPVSAYSALTDLEAIARVIGDGDRKIMEDHKQFRCGHVLIRDHDGEKSCYCIYTSIIRNSLRFSHIQYLSNAPVFLEAVDVIGAGIFSLKKTLFMKVDCRLLPRKNVPRSLRYRVTSPRMYRSETVRPEQIDNLYSELIILNL